MNIGSLDSLDQAMTHRLNRSRCSRLPADQTDRLSHLKHLGAPEIQRSLHGRFVQWFDDLEPKQHGDFDFQGELKQTWIWFDIQGD